MRRSFALAIMVLGAVILTGSVAIRAQQEDPYEPVATSNTADTDNYTTADTPTPVEPVDRDHDHDVDVDVNMKDKDVDVDVNHDADARMPRTASPVPLIALIGVLSVGTSLCLRMSRYANGAVDASKR